MNVRWLPEPLRWAAFRTLEWLSDLKGNPARKLPEPIAASPGPGALWLYVSTIGELNAIEPLLRHLRERLPGLAWVLITEHAHYRDAYLAKYPQAQVFITRGHSRDARHLARRQPPALLMLAEIPAWPSEGPCRFSYAFVRAAKRAGARVLLVNAWLYGYTPRCTMDRIEHSLFAHDYLSAFDFACVQNQTVADTLVTAGLGRARLQVTGNLKFDALDRQAWTPDQARSPNLLKALLEAHRPILVAGCVTDHDEMERVFDAFARLRARHPDALLIHAPRHPEYPDNLRKIEALAERHQLRLRFRSRIEDAPLPPDTDGLVLDTMGELRDFYAAATLAHVGVDHNILEPMSFGRPVSVSPGWHPTYPSYPVYQAMLAAGGIRELAHAEDLAKTWIELLEQPDLYQASRDSVDGALDQARGALKRSLDALIPFLPRP
ncbi:MAG: 3-deoxy-D-manno-octulosonic acid transferase [Pseudomonadota bacterium]